MAYLHTLLILALVATVAVPMSLPQVVGFGNTEPPPPPPPPPPPMPELGPPQFADIEGRWPLYVKVYEWLTVNGYCEELPSNLDDVIEGNLTEYVKPCIIAMKSFYNITEEGEEPNEELTREVLDIMSLPRCSQPDVQDGKDNKNGKNTRKRRWARLGNTLWRDSNMPLKIKFKNYLSSLSRSDQEKAARHCADLWAKSSSLYFELVSSSASYGNIEIQFKHIDGPWNTVGKGLSPVPYMNPPSSYLQLDSGEKWKASAKDSNYGVSLIWALCHEMGHNLGLSHSNDRKAIMYPSGVGQSEEKLGSDDARGIASLYPPRSKPKPSPPTPKPQPPPPPTPKPQPPPPPPTPKPLPPTRNPRPPPTTSQPRPPPTTFQPRPPPTTFQPRPPPTTFQPRPRPTPSRRQPQRRYRPRPRPYPRPYPQPYPQRWPYYQPYVPRVYAHQNREPRLPPPGHIPRYRPVG